jgi:hypothetical protein
MLHQWVISCGFNLSVCLSGTKERYSGKQHDTKDLVEKAKLDIVVFRSVSGPQRSWILLCRA